MKAFFVLLFVLCCSATVQAQLDWSVTDKPVGVGPSEVFADSANSRIHVLTNGNDANFNGIFEPETDISAGWYVLDPAGNRIDSTFFGGFFNSLPIRVGVDLKKGILYAPVNGKIGSFSLETLEPINPALIDENLATASFDPESETLILSRRAADFSSPGEIVYYDTEDNVLLGRVGSGVNPGNGFAQFYRDLGRIDLYSINEGGFGQTNSSLTFMSFAPSIFNNVNEKPLGGGGSDIAIDGTHAFIAMGGTHQVRIVDLLTHREIAPSPITVGTDGFDGPRALALAGDTLIVGTYSSDIRRFDLKTGELIDIIPMPGKVESLALYRSSLYAAISYTAGTYDKDSLLVVVDMRSGEPTDTIVVGGQPAAVFPDFVHENIVVMGYGAGENPMPWWSVIEQESADISNTGILPYNLSFPLRAAINPVANMLIFVGSDTLFSLDLSAVSGLPQVLYVDPEGSGDLFGVSDGGEHWLVTERPLNFEARPGYLHMVRKSDGERMMKFPTSGPFALTAVPIPSKVPGGMATYILHEGNFGSQDASLALVDYAPHLYEGELGSGANYIMHDVDDFGREITALAMTGSHEVLLLNLLEDGVPDIQARIPTGTTALDGPRQCVVPSSVPMDVSNPLLVTTYSGEVLFMGNGQVLKRENIGGKGEGIATVGDKVYTANSFETGTYDPGSTVSVITLIHSSVDESRSVAGITLEQNYPNPVNDRTTISFTLDHSTHVSVTLYSMAGEIVAEIVDGELEGGEHQLTIGTDNLPEGSYIYSLNAGSQRLTRKMEVVR